MPWYRQFWPWVLIALPASSIVTSGLLILAAIADPDGLVVDNYYKEGLALNRNLAVQRQAEAMGLRADFIFYPEAGTVRVLVEAAEPQQATLRLVHPTRARKDLQSELYRDMHGGLSGVIGVPRQGYWRIVLEPADASWRLVGRLALPERVSTTLLPG